MLRGFSPQSLYDSLSDHPHPWLKLQHNIMAEHYKAFKSFVMSASTMNNMLQNQQIHKMKSQRHHQPSKRYLLCPKKPVAFSNTKENEYEKNPHEHDENQLCEHQAENELNLTDSDVCSTTNFPLFEEVAIEDANHKESNEQNAYTFAPTQTGIVSSSELNSPRQNNGIEGKHYVNKLQSHNSDVMWSCYSSVSEPSSVKSSTFVEDCRQHSPPENNIVSSKDVAKYLSETPPQNNKLQDISRQDIEHLNRHFRYPVQVKRTSILTGENMNEALDLSRPKLKRERPQDDNTKPDKRRRVSQTKKKMNKENESQLSAVDFSLNSQRLPKISKSTTVLTDEEKGDTKPIILTIRCNKSLERNNENSRKTGNGAKKKDTSFVLTEKGQLTQEPGAFQKNKNDENTETSIKTNETTSSPAVNGKAKIHACKYCGKMFAQRSSVHTHERTHTGVRPYKCEYCGRDFIDCSTYTKHVRLHTGERPYMCDVCGRGFTQSGNMLRHKVARHPDVPKSNSGTKKVNIKVNARSSISEQK